MYLNTDDSYKKYKSLLKNINVSSYSDELKSNYKGALCTRVKSLTNGLVGRIFSSDEINEEILFDQNTIVDLSRIGSTETKSLITGILFIKLQEHRMTSSEGTNQKLKHITVLEEAHNLLRKTSTTQSAEGANLQGKSVEMISNSIAEMRTYGEGFIISDQAPNLLDESAIRNTNTKIILRLPQLEDRESVGKSASLNEDQINEIPKLKTGVAVVYQNNWMEPVLCKVDRFDDEKPLIYYCNQELIVKNLKKVKGDLIKILIQNRLSEDNIRLDNINMKNVIEYASQLRIPSYLRNIIIFDLDNLQMDSYLNLWKKENFDKLNEIIFLLLDGEKVISYCNTAKNMSEWNNRFYNHIYSSIDMEELSLSDDFNKSIVQCLLSHKAIDDKEAERFYCIWIEANNTIKLI